MAKKQTKRVKVDRYAPVVIETFNDSTYTLQDFSRFNQPSSFNGNVQIRRYRITRELIDEPREVLCERLQKLWDEGDNHHYWQPLKSAAQELGYELVGDFGRFRKR